MNSPIPNFYDPENARQLVAFAADAYCSVEPPAQAFEAQPRHYITDVATDTQAVIYQPTAQDIVVAFRGTRSLRNFVTDLTARRVPLLDGPAGAEVHEGFQTAFQSVSRDLGEYLKNNLSAQQRLWFTGHSLGGALAKLAAARFFREHAIAGVYTFGEPRVGNAAFRNFYGWLRPKTFRVVDGEDFIPRLPWLLGAYRHSGTEVFYGSWECRMQSAEFRTPHSTLFTRYLIDPPWWQKGLSDVFGTWAEWQRDGRLALLADHHVNRYLKMLNAKCKVQNSELPTLHSPLPT